MNPSAPSAVVLDGPQNAESGGVSGTQAKGGVPGPPDGKGGGNGNGSGSGNGAGVNGNGAGSANGTGTAGPGGISVSGSGSMGSETKMAAVIPLSPAPPAPAGPMPAPSARRGQGKPGVFDVVVVQSTAAETQFRSFGILKGKPVYTVYLQLGMPKTWVLQYCLPSTSSANAQPGVVNLDNPQPVTPPYPITTVLTDVELQPKAGYTLIHGFLTAAGKFRNMILLGKPDQQLARLLQLLEEWEFRPAMKGDTAAEVEVLLAIPPV